MELQKAHNIVNGTGGICATEQEAGEALKLLIKKEQEAKQCK